MAIDTKADSSPETGDEGVLEKFARTIGKASGAVVSVASRVLPNSEPEKHSDVSARGRARNSGDAKQAAGKRQKRKTHKRKLKRANTKG